jgi:hypothetical protein
MNNSSTYDVTYVITNTIDLNGKIIETKENKRMTTLKDIVAQLGITNGYSSNPLYKKLVRIMSSGADIKQAVSVIFGSNK